MKRFIDPTQPIEVIQLDSYKPATSITQKAITILLVAAVVCVTFLLPNQVNEVVINNPVSGRVDQE